MAAQADLFRFVCVRAVGSADERRLAAQAISLELPETARTRVHAVRREAENGFGLSTEGALGVR